MLDNLPQMQWTAVRIQRIFRSFCLAHPQHALKLYGFVSHVRCPSWEIEAAWFTFGKLLRDTAPSDVADIHPVALHRLHLLHHHYAKVEHDDLMPVTYLGVTVPACGLGSRGGRCTQCADVMANLTRLVKDKSALLVDPDIASMDNPPHALCRLRIRFSLRSLRTNLRVAARSIWDISSEK